MSSGGSVLYTVLILEKETKTVSKLYVGFPMFLCFISVYGLETGLCGS